MSDRPLVLGTRCSALALAQTTLVRQALAASHPELRVEVREFKTTGDKRQDLSLASAVHGDAGVKVEKGLFTKELEEALLAGEIDAAVHSLKDLPTAHPPGLEVTAVLPRAATEDVLILKAAVDPADPLAALPPGATVATSSVRRMLQLQYLRPDLQVVEVRGNVGTRLGKLRDRSEWHALILARAGLERLGYAPAAGRLDTEGATLTCAILPQDLMLPAVGQGAIALQTRADDFLTASRLDAINHRETFAAVTAEREMLRLLGGGCQAPVGAATRIEGRELQLRALHFALAGQAPRTAEVRGDAGDPHAIAAAAVAQLAS